MTGSRITITRDGVVKLNGQATRWSVRKTRLNDWMARRWEPNRAQIFDLRTEARAYLATLTDAELMG
jgi:hypothetical protein